MEQAQVLLKSLDNPKQIGSDTLNAIVDKEGTLALDWQTDEVKIAIELAVYEKSVRQSSSRLRLVSPGMVESEERAAVGSNWNSQVPRSKPSQRVFHASRTINGRLSLLVMCYLTNTFGGEMKGDDTFHLNEFGVIESGSPEDVNMNVQDMPKSSDSSGFGGPNGFEVTVSLPDGTSRSIAGEDNRAFILALGVVAGVDFDALPVFDWFANKAVFNRMKYDCVQDALNSETRSDSTDIFRVWMLKIDLESDFLGFDSDALMDKVDAGTLTDDEAWSIMSSGITSFVDSFCQQLGFRSLGRCLTYPDWAFTFQS